MSRCLDGNAALRAKLTGLPGDLELLSGADKLDLYQWVMPGEEQQSVASISEERCRYFIEFVGTRTAACAADKAVALGQIFFRVLFPDTATAHVFFQEMAVSLATSTSPYTSNLNLIDNTGWGASSMSGSADVSRYLMGTPGFLQKCGEVVNLEGVLRHDDARHRGSWRRRPRLPFQTIDSTRRGMAV